MGKKTLYLLAYVQDEAYRRRMLVQLNCGEGHHVLARAVFHGKKGELRQRYREGTHELTLYYKTTDLTNPLGYD